MIHFLMTLYFYGAFMIGILLGITLIIVLPIKLIFSLFVRKRKRTQTEVHPIQLNQNIKNEILNLTTIIIDTKSPSNNDQNSISRALFYKDEIIMSPNFLTLPNKQIARKKYINVPFSKKDEAKQRGARWDPNKRSWYVPEDLMLSNFMEWYELSSKCGQAICPSCNDFSLHFFDVQIHGKLSLL